ncbi:cytochrome P450 72A15-like [Senna tora]|uniref:Cytochrome P450 72A15-like n=1 Tax=Senna tora TaxID=362788 RepID=A0A834X457_9FABA|nr:cytochrome P450 72A15-like [Senna tora]
MLQRNLKQQGIMGTPYRPLIGDMKEFVKLITQAWSKPMNLNHKIVSRVDPFTLNNVQKYGKISMCWSGTSPRLIIKDPELMRQVLSNKQGHFQKPPLNPNILIITKGLSTLEGYKWERRRKTLNPAFHMERLKEMLPVFSTSCSKMIERWQNKSKLEEGKCEIDVWPELQKLTADVISRAAFGSNYEEGERIFELLRELTILVVEAMQTLYLPGFRFIPTKKNQRRKELNREIRSMLRDLIQRKKHALRHGESRVDDDLLGLLLQSISQNNDDGNESYKMTEEDVVEECKQFYVAGHETTSSWLTWTMVVLAMHPDWQEKARNEVLQIGHRQELNYKTITKLKIINMILYEVVRLYPPVIALYQHTSKETKIGDISLPSGVDLTLPILLLNHDPQIWGDDAEEFKPERFSEGVSKASNEQLAFFPFSWGPRTCIGQNFAMLEAKMAIAMILQHFSWDLSPSYVHAPYTVMTLQPQHGAQITLHPF